MKLNFDNRFVTELPADPDTTNTRRQVNNACYSLVNPITTKQPELVSYSAEAAELIDLSEADCQSTEFLNVFSGNKVADGMQPHAMCYGGHQFGNWAGQLGDGRAIVLGEATNANSEHWSLQLKGAGPTPYSRTADGLAVLRSSVREFLCSEAMYHLGVPTTRALSLMTTGDQVVRDMLYDGNPAHEPGAVVCRMAPSFIRFGSFQIFSSRNQIDELRKLCDYTVQHHFAHLLQDHKLGSPECVVALFERVCSLTLKMIIDWARVGFVHGVMNTDNMSIHGLTIDYGPYGWLDNYDPQWTPNTTDASHRRYRFGQQANIALWNCYQLANALYPLVEKTEPLEAALQNFQSDFVIQWQTMMAQKLGLETLQEQDGRLFEQLEELLTATETDMTRFYRALAAEDLSYEHFVAKDVYYTDDHSTEYRTQLDHWLAQYSDRLSQQPSTSEERFMSMNQVNPKFVFRNYLAQQAIDLSEAGDHSMINQLLETFRSPYAEQTEHEHLANKRPEWARTKVGCSMLSCSS